MTIQKITLSSLILVLASFFILSCGNTGTAENAATTPEKTVKPTKRVGGDTPPEARKEYASAYICPMHCKGSGSGVAGKCPVCGMDYVANKNVEGKSQEEHNHEGHNHGSHEGHDHGSHEGHDHGSHEGHNH